MGRSAAGHLRSLRCTGHLWLGSRARAERARIDTVLRLVGATDYATRPIGTVSGGEQQRLLIAQALVTQPRLLLLDEPLEGLDLPNQQAVATVIRRISQAEGVTTLLVAHDVNPILPYLDRVLYMARGKVLLGRLTRSSPPRCCRSSTTPAWKCCVPATGGSLSQVSQKMGCLIMLEPAPSWNLVADVQDLLRFHFMQNALLAGTLVAVVAGLVGYFMVLRSASFAGHTLANVGFAGAAGATLVGVAPVVGLLASGLLAALGIGAWASRVAVAGTARTSLSGRSLRLRSDSACSLNASPARPRTTSMRCFSGRCSVLATPTSPRSRSPQH